MATVGIKYQEEPLHLPWALISTALYGLRRFLDWKVRFHRPDYYYNFGDYSCSLTVEFFMLIKKNVFDL
jgi:hypothetical protein